MEPLLRPWPPLLNMGPRPLPCPPTVSMMHCLHMVTEDPDRPLMLCQFTFLAPLATKMGDPFMPIIMSDSQFYSKSKITGGIYYPYLTIYTYLSSVFSYYSRFCYSSFLNMLLKNKTLILLIIKTYFMHNCWQIDHRVFCSLSSWRDKRTLDTRMPPKMGVWEDLIQLGATKYLIGSKKGSILRLMKFFFNMGEFQTLNTAKICYCMN